ncbi:MAG: mevalonate kinase [Methanothrix sp.]|nr:mevalonate kinase [Methanothrix sp.]
MTCASAPGKVILFGEHAVVSGFAAIGGAIGLRARVTLSDLPGRTVIRASNLAIREFSLDLESGHLISREAEHATRYVSAVLRKFDLSDISVSVESEIPPASGLGSSAAIVVATMAALNSHLSLGLSREDLAHEAHRIERSVQGGLGSPMDTALSTFGGYLRISGGIEQLDLPAVQLVVGYTGQPHETRLLVERVQGLRARYPDLVDPIFHAIGAISARGVALLKEERLEELGELMNINHGLLEALGVGTRELCDLVYAARGAGGALGAKLTGAGGGGCIIALPPPGGASSVITAISQARGEAFLVQAGCEGVRLEMGE